MPKIPWLISSVYSIVLFALTVRIWVVKDLYYEPNPLQLSSQAKIKAFLTNWEKNFDSRGETPVYIPTGVFIQSVEFNESNNIDVTGYVWQEYSLSRHTDVSRGFILPEAISSTVMDAYRHVDGDSERLGWYFKATIRQSFNFACYPLDQNEIRIRLWHKDFFRDTVLVPDLISYDSTKPGQVFGIEPDIVLNGWRISETYFTYELTNYDTNFGIDHYVGQKGFPELYFEIAVKRYYLDAIIFYIIPLVLVAVLMFATLLATSVEKERTSIFGFNSLNVYRMVGGVLFACLIGHSKLRQGLFTSGVVYIEYFYLITYLLLIGVVFNIHQVSISREHKLWYIEYGDNFIAKVTYWPLVSSAVFVVTYLFGR